MGSGVAVHYTREKHARGKICWPIVPGRSQAGRTQRAGAQSWGTSDLGRLEAVEVCNLMIKRTLWDWLTAVHKDIFAADFERIGLHSDRGVRGYFAGGHVVLPAVPRAGDNIGFELALAQWAAAMQAGIV